MKRASFFFIFEFKRGNGALDWIKIPNAPERVNDINNKHIRREVIVMGEKFEFQKRGDLRVNPKLSRGTITDVFMQAL